MPSLTPSQLLAEIEDAIRQVPSRSDEAAFIAWTARAVMLVKRWAPSRAITADSYASGSFLTAAGIAQSESRKLLLLLHEARQDLRLNEVGPLSTTLDRGAVLDYFEEIRKLIAAAQRELFFVDPYLDAEFVHRYLPHVPSGVAVRLLGRKGLSALMPAVELAMQQFQLSVELRSSHSLHDRFLFVDRTRGFHSGASFKDGARLAPTIFTEVSDALQGTLGVYEQMWQSATVYSPSAP
jgi:hypothetical protein